MLAPRTVQVQVGANDAVSAFNAFHVSGQNIHCRDPLLADQFCGQQVLPTLVDFRILPEIPRAPSAE